MPVILPFPPRRAVPEIVPLLRLARRVAVAAAGT